MSVIYVKLWARITHFFFALTFVPFSHEIIFLSQKTHSKKILFSPCGCLWLHNCMFLFWYVYFFNACVLRSKNELTICDADASAACTCRLTDARQWCVIGMRTLCHHTERILLKMRSSARNRPEMLKLISVYSYIISHVHEYIIEANMNL